MSNKIDKLAFHFPYIANICPSWAEVLHLAEPLTVKKNKNIINVDKNGLNFYFIESGVFQLKYFSTQGKCRTVMSYGENALFCIPSSYLQIDNTDSSMFCIRDGKIWKFNGKILTDENFIKAYPLLHHEMIQQLSAQLITAVTYATNMLLEPNLERTICFLLAYEIEKQKNNSLPKFTQEEIAEMLNMHRVTFVKILQNLKKENLIEFQQRQEIKLLDIHALKRKISSLQFPLP